MSDNPKILFLDIETSGMIGYHWGRWDQRISQPQVIAESVLLSYAWKWRGEKTVKADALCNYEGAVKERNEYPLLEGLHALLDEADIVVGHYVKRFDIPEINRGFLIHGFQPPSPYRMVCTKEAAKKYFRFSSNRLGDLGIMLGLGGKLSHEGFEMWRKCMEDECPKAWDKMVRYNKQDVALLEKVYDRLLPYLQTHPNLAVLRGASHVCPKCGSKHLQARGFAYTNVGRWQRWQCQSCGGWSRSRDNNLTAEEKRGITINIGGN